MTLPVQKITHGRLVLGASEIGIVMGVNPYKTPIELWQEKRGELPGFSGNSQTDWGQALEPLLRQWYVDSCSEPVWVPPESLFHPEHEWCRASPDGVVLRDAAADPADRSNWVRGVECKKVSWRLSSLWGEPGTDEVMPSYLLQCQQGMAVTGLELWELPVTIGGEPPVVYRIERDDELIQMILDAGADFVARIESGEPPVLDNTEAYADYLASRHPWSRDEYLVATPEIEAVAETLRETQALYKQAEEDIKGLKNQIAAFVGDASGVETSLGKVNYKTRRGRPDPMAVIDHLAEAYTIPRSEIDELLAANRYKDSRPVQAYWRKGSK